MTIGATLDALHELGSRVGGDVDLKPDLGAATGVVNDVGRALVVAPVQDLRTMQAAISSVRERLRFADGAIQSPNAALSGPQGESYLAGALWAADDILSSCLATRDRTAERVRSKGLQRTLQDIVVRLLRDSDQVTPADVIAYAKCQGLQARPDQVSKALSDLLSRRVIAVAPLPVDADRRTRYFELSNP